MCGMWFLEFHKFIETKGGPQGEQGGAHGKLNIFWRMDRCDVVRMT